MKSSDIVRVVAVIAAAGLFSACAHQSVKKTSETTAAPASADTTAGLPQAEPDVRAAATISVPELKTVYFDYNSDALKAPARQTLAANAAWLKDHPEVKVQVAGNTDQRGTVEYNLALGQRRANAVREYYRMLGLSGSRVATISYGKEKPVCSRSSEECWKQNRRAQTLEAVAQTVGSSRR